MTLLVVEVHPINLIFLWCLSFFVRVKAYRLHPACPRILSRRVQVLDLDNYFTQNANHCFRSHVMQLWEKVLEKFPTDSWSLRYEGHLLDFSTKARQALSAPFERLIMLREIQGQEGQTSMPGGEYVESRVPRSPIRWGSRRVLQYSSSLRPPPTALSGGVPGAQTGRQVFLLPPR